MNRISTAFAAAALAVALLGITPLGEAATNVVRTALFAQNAGKVANIRASRTPAAGQLLPLDEQGKFPASVLPAGMAGAQGERGPQGVPGPTGSKGSSGVTYVRTILVGPDPLNDANNGTHLLDALNKISDNGPLRPYLVKIEPGIYDLGSRSLALKPYVDVEGSGEVTTTISGKDATPGVVIGTSNSELRFLTVRSERGVAISSDASSPRLLHVTARSSGGLYNHAIATVAGSPVLNAVTASAADGTEAVAVMNFGSNLTALNSSFSASGAGSQNVALYSSYGGANNVSSTKLTAAGGAYAVGLRVFNGSHTLANVTAVASGATEAYGVYSGYKTNAPNVAVHQSRISGSTNSVLVLGGPVRIGASQVTGSAAAVAPGTVVCASSYSGTFVQLTAACSE